MYQMKSECTIDIDYQSSLDQDMMLHLANLTDLLFAISRVQKLNYYLYCRHVLKLTEQTALDLDSLGSLSSTEPVTFDGDIHSSFY